MKQGRSPIAVAAFLAALFLFVPGAGAKIFWANQNKGGVLGSIGGANTGGRGVDQNLVPNVDDPCAVATDGQHVYWATRTGKIGRANEDGTGVEPGLVTGIRFTCGQIAVDGAHIYWTEQSQANPAIGRANLDGTNVQRSWLPLPQQFPLGLAIDGGHIYWTWQRNTHESDIGRADIDGTGVTSGFIQGGSTAPWFLAVDAAHIYASPLASRTVLRANLDGTGVNTGFMEIPPQDSSCGLAADDSHLYWGAFGKKGNSVGRANSDGTGADPSFITGGQDTCGVAVGPSLSPQPQFSLGRVHRNERRGTATLVASVSGPGRLVLGGAGLRREVSAARGPGDVKLAVVPKADTKRVLDRTGRARVTAKVTFHHQIKHRALTLKKNR